MLTWLVGEMWPPRKEMRKGKEYSGRLKDEMKRGMNGGWARAKT
jgi:hypothetical protein